MIKHGRNRTLKEDVLFLTTPQKIWNKIESPAQSGIAEDKHLRLILPQWMKKGKTSCLRQKVNNILYKRKIMQWYHWGIWLVNVMYNVNVKLTLNKGTDLNILRRTAVLTGGHNKYYIWFIFFCKTQKIFWSILSWLSVDKTCAVDKWLQNCKIID